MFPKHTRKEKHEIDPDEIFLDAHNLPHFDQHQLEGRFEHPISKAALTLLSVLFALTVTVLFGRLFMLQVVEYDTLRERAENNRLRQIPLFAERGVIFDRNGEELAWNEPFKDRQETFPRRVYTSRQGFAHVLGYISYPGRDEAGYYYNELISGQQGIEHAFNRDLAGRNGLRLIETDASGNLHSRSIIHTPEDGSNITTTIDARIQRELFDSLGITVNTYGFTGGAGIIMDVQNGEILALSSFPEYDPNILSLGKESEIIESYINDPQKPFLNRAVSGLYTPGSIVKPFIALAALNENVITPEEEILSTGSISIPNPYFPDRESVFRDWKAHGWVDMRKAIAASSNVYFYEISGGYENRTGLGIWKIESYMKKFGFGRSSDIAFAEDKKGLVPTPDWKEETFVDKWRVGDTYNTAIGQYGFQITPIQAVRATAAIANGGPLLVPILKKSSGEKPKSEQIFISKKHFKVVREGMRKAVLEGTAQGIALPFVSVAAKTGTAEVGIKKQNVNSWIIGFFPYDKPRFAFAVVLEKGPRENLVGALSVMRNLLVWMYENAPEYF